jgi:hypothetical protein
MTEAFPAALERVRDIARGQTVGYQRLLAFTREGNEALRTNDIALFEKILAEQAATLEELRQLERERGSAMQEAGVRTARIEDDLEEGLKHLAAQIARENGVRRFVVSRRESIVLSRIGLLRQSGALPEGAQGSVDQTA